MKNSLRRITAVLVTLLLALSLLPTAVLADGDAQEPELSAGASDGTPYVAIAQSETACDRGAACPLAGYDDLDPAAWYHDGVHSCLGRGLMGGVAAGSFAPEDATSRAMAVTVLWRMAGCPAVDAAVRFEDVAADAWYAGAVRWAALAGIVKGTDGGRFAPEAPVTRQELAALLYRYTQYAHYTVGAEETDGLRAFADAQDVDIWAAPAVRWAVRAGLLQGENGVLRPEESASRAQTAVLLCRYADWKGQAVPVSADGAVWALYDAAVRDAAFADPDEIFPLVALTHEDDRTTWDAAGERVLLLCLHRYPDSYPEGEQVTFRWGAVWTFAGEEMARWYDANGEDVIDWSLRLNQLLGVPPDKAYTHVTAFWVDPDDVVRPAYTTDPAAQMDPALQKTWEEDSWYAGWFDGNILWSYFDSAYPWTRLGYTYDWADNGTEYGLTEFLIYPDSEVTVAYTLPVEAYIAALAAGASAR